MKETSNIMQQICCVCVTFFSGRFESSNMIGFIFKTLTSWAAPAVKKGFHLVPLLKCSPAPLWQILSCQISLFEEQSYKRAVSKVWRRAFLRECSLGFSKMPSNILCQNALLTKCSFHKEHFLGDYFAKEYGRAFLREQKSILAK